MDKGASGSVCSGLLIIYLSLFESGGDWVGLTSIVYLASLSERQIEVRGGPCPGR